MELDREEILEALRRVALSKPNDAISLALQPMRAAWTSGASASSKSTAQAAWRSNSWTA